MVVLVEFPLAGIDQRVGPAGISWLLQEERALPGNFVVSFFSSLCSAGGLGTRSAPALARAYPALVALFPAALALAKARSPIKAARCCWVVVSSGVGARVRGCWRRGRVVAVAGWSRLEGGRPSRAMRNYFFLKMQVERGPKCTLKTQDMRVRCPSRKLKGRNCPSTWGKPETCSRGSSPSRGRR